LADWSESIGGKTQELHYNSSGSASFLEELYECLKKESSKCTN
jgi:hypothetical protein